MSSYLSKLRNLIPSWRDNVAQFEVYIYEREYCQIEDWVLQKKDIETGGDLFGLWIDSHKAVVQFVLGPGRKCERTNVSFYQDISYLSNVGDYLLKNHGLCNIGQWHSHHRMKLDRPSAGDERTVWNNLPDLNLKAYIVFIATIKDGRDGRPAVDINCFLFELDVNGSPLPVQKGQFKKINKDSPMRLHREILECSSYGAEPVKPAIDHSGNQQGNIESGSYDALSSTSRRKNDSENNACSIELLENKNELENTNEQPKVLKQDGEKEEGKEGLKEDEKEGEEEGKEEDEKEEEKEGKEEEEKEEEERGRKEEDEKEEKEGKEEDEKEGKEEEEKEGKEEERKEEEEGKEEGKEEEKGEKKEKEEEGMEEKKEKQEVEEGKEKGEQQEREEEDREEEKEEVKCRTGNMSKGGDTLDNVDAIGTESREMQLAKQNKKEMEEYGRKSDLTPQDKKETITLLQKSTNCNTNVNFEDGKGTKNERKDNKTTKESDGDKSKEKGEGFKPGNMTSIEAHVKELPGSVSTKINFDETRSTKNGIKDDKATKKNGDTTKQKGEVKPENTSLLEPDVEEISDAINTEMNFGGVRGSQDQKANMENGDKSRDQGKLENIKWFEQRVEEMPEFINTEIHFDEAVKHDEILASSTDENTSTENGDKQRKTATKEDNLEETATGSKDDSRAKYKVMSQKEDEISDTPL